MARFAAVFSRVSDICVAAVLGVACAGAVSAQDSGARVRLLEEKLIQASPGSLPVVSYSVHDIGRIAGAVRLALPESGGHALVLTETGTVWAWGDNRKGQLGVGDTAVHPDLVAVPGLDSVAAIAAGAGHSIALRRDGSVWTWGANEQGQSGDGSLWARSRPERVQGLHEVVAVAAGARYTLALRRDGTVWAWGSNWTGVAPGVAEKVLLPPVEVRGLEKVEAIWVRGDRPYARDPEGRQWTWGTPEAGLRQVEFLLEPETTWRGPLGRDRSVRVMESSLEVEESREVVARFEVGSAPVDLVAGWAVGWLEEVAVTGERIFRDPAIYALAPEATVKSGPRLAGGAEALPASTTTLAPAPNPSIFGATVALTAAVSPSVATGRVTFYDGTTVLGVGSLDSGTATLQSTLLPAGNRSLRAYYWGDANYLASMSGWVTQTVNAQPANTFLAAVNYGAGNSASSVTIGDFNGDGKADLAVANFGHNNVSVLLGNSNGTFQEAVDYAVGGGPIAVTVGDFNGDGKADLAVANLSVGNVGVLLGNGNGTFQAAINYTTASGAQAVAVGDFNEDGKPDLVVANWSSNNVTVLLGNGNGTFQEGVNYAAASWPSPVMVGDFNGDGKADLAVANAASDNVSVLLGNGNGTFQAAVNYAAGDVPDSVAVADFNADGKADLAVANYLGDNVSLLLGNGNGTFQAAVNYGVSSGPYSVAVGDFNGDGQADLVVTNNDGNNVSLLLGNGNGTFQAAVNYGAGTGPHSVAVGDLDGDGTADLAVANNGSNNVSVLLGVAFPTADSVLPSSGGAASQSFTFKFSSAAGYQNLGIVNVLVNFWLDGRQSCYLAYSQPSSVLYLVNDAVGGLLPGLTLGGSGSVANSQCTVYSAGSSAVGNGNTLTLTLSMSFSSTFGGSKIMYLAARDVLENNSGWQRMGVWTVPGGAQTTTTAVVGMNPARGSGAGGTFTFTFTDTQGANDLGVVNVLVNDWLNGNQACYLAYALGNNSLYLVNDAGNGLLPPLVVNGSGSLSNSQCMVTGAGTSAVANGNTLTLTLNLTFGASFTGNRIFYLAARDLNELNNTGWQASGSWTAP